MKTRNPFDVVPTRVAAKADLIVTITYNADPDEDHPYQLMVVKNRGPRNEPLFFDAFETLTKHLDDLCEEVFVLRNKNND